MEVKYKMKYKIGISADAVHYGDYENFPINVYVNMIVEISNDFLPVGSTITLGEEKWEIIEKGEQ
jgi:hypothetical protein